jgi:hypothetical protein
VVDKLTRELRRKRTSAVEGLLKRVASMDASDEEACRALKEEADQLCGNVHIEEHWRPLPSAFTDWDVTVHRIEGREHTFRVRADCEQYAEELALREAANFNFRDGSECGDPQYEVVAIQPPDAE